MELSEFLNGIEEKWVSWVLKNYDPAKNYLQLSENRVRLDGKVGLHKHFGPYELGSNIEEWYELLEKNIRPVKGIYIEPIGFPLDDLWAIYTKDPRTVGPLDELLSAGAKVKIEVSDSLTDSGKRETYYYGFYNGTTLYDVPSPYYVLSKNVYRVIEGKLKRKFFFVECLELTTGECIKVKRHGDAKYVEYEGVKYVINNR